MNPFNIHEAVETIEAAADDLLVRRRPPGDPRRRPHHRAAAAAGRRQEARPGRAAPLRRAPRHLGHLLRRRVHPRHPVPPGRRGGHPRHRGAHPRRHPRPAVRQAGPRRRPTIGFGIVTSADVYRQGADEVVDQLRQRIGDRPLYISIDIDVLDPAHAPGTGTPEAGGMTSRELLEILRGFAASTWSAPTWSRSPRPTTTPRSPAWRRPTSPTTWSRLLARLSHDHAVAPDDGERSDGRNGGDLVVETLTALGATPRLRPAGPARARHVRRAAAQRPAPFVSSRVENNAAFAADAYARVTGEVGPLFLSTGPGALTSLAALQEAYATGVPLARRSPARSHAPGSAARRHGMLHELDDQQASLRDVVKSAPPSSARSPRSPPPSPRRGSRRRPRRTGPTWVEIPQDVLLEPTDVPPVVRRRWTRSRRGRRRRAPN